MTHSEILLNLLHIVSNFANPILFASYKENNETEKYPLAMIYGTYLAARHTAEHVGYSSYFDISEKSFSDFSEMEIIEMINHLISWITAECSNHISVFQGE